MKQLQFGYTTRQDGQKILVINDQPINDSFVEFAVDEDKWYASVDDRKAMRLVATATLQELSNVFSTLAIRIGSDEAVLTPRVEFCPEEFSPIGAAMLEFEYDLSKRQENIDWMYRDGVDLTVAPAGE